MLITHMKNSIKLVSNYFIFSTTSLIMYSKYLTYRHVGLTKLCTIAMRSEYIKSRFMVVHLIYSFFNSIKFNTSFQNNFEKDSLRIAVFSFKFVFNFIQFKRNYFNITPINRQCSVLLDNFLQNNH